MKILQITSQNYFEMIRAKIKKRRLFDVKEGIDYQMYKGKMGIVQFMSLGIL